MSLCCTSIELQAPARACELGEPDNARRWHHHLSESAIMSSGIIDYYTC
jgi:hypothetical protein